jgi:NADPH-dependent curcumin reductase CurA
MRATKNRRIVLAARPTGEPIDENFPLEESDIPTLAEGRGCYVWSISRLII